MTPPWLHFVGTSPTALPDAAVVAAPPEAAHIGVAWRDTDGNLRWLHLAFHHRLRNEAVPADHAWVASRIEPERLALVAAMCERVVARNGRRIPYGFRYVASRFVDDGSLVLGPDERGLTCATFVLAIYASVGITLLHLDDWTPRDDDRERLDELVALLREHCDDEKHIDAVAQEVKGVRFRPAEVAGGSSEPLPCGFAQAVSAAASLVAALSARGTQTQP